MKDNYIPVEVQYLQLLQEVMSTGQTKEPARPGMPATRELFSRTLVCDLQKEFPLFTTKRMPFKTIMAELFWFFYGENDVKLLIDQKCEIWTKYAYKYYALNNREMAMPFEKWYEAIVNGEITGECGAIYGKQWREFNGHFDQIENVISSIVRNPNSRYHIITAWNPVDFIEHPENAALPCCPCFWQFSVRNGRYLDMQLVQRSCDLFLGVPFDITEYAVFQHIIAALTGYEAGIFNWLGTSVHIYENHFDQVNEQLTRIPFSAPILIMDNTFGPHTVSKDHFKVIAYEHYPKLSGDLAVGV